MFMALHLFAVFQNRSEMDDSYESICLNSPKAQILAASAFPSNISPCSCLGSRHSTSPQEKQSEEPPRQVSDSSDRSETNNQKISSQNPSPSFETVEKRSHHDEVANSGNSTTKSHREAKQEKTASEMSHSNEPCEFCKNSSNPVQPKDSLIASNSNPALPKQETKTPGKSFFLPKRIAISHVTGTGIGMGFTTDYTTMDILFASLPKPGHFIPMIDLRGHRFDDNTYATNVGLIARYVPESNTFCQLLGFNMYYDYRQGVKGHYNQIGVGIEALGKRLDFRGNAYVPLSKMKHLTNCLFDQYIGDYFINFRKEECVAYGFNAEVGYLIVRSKQFLLYSATGPYYLSKKSNMNTQGWEFRLRPQYKDFCAVDLELSYDPLFNWVFQGRFIVSLPLYQIACKKDDAPCGITNRQIYQPVERFEVIPLQRRCCVNSNF